MICITMDFCNSFPEMACAKDKIEGVICNEFLNCKEKMTHVRAVSDNIVSQNYRNSIQIIPFSHIDTSYLINIQLSWIVMMITDIPHLFLNLSWRASFYYIS
jgi:hypothetical protein